MRGVLNPALGAHEYRMAEAETAERGAVAARSHTPGLGVLNQQRLIPMGSSDRAWAWLRAAISHRALPNDRPVRRGRGHAQKNRGPTTVARCATRGARVEFLL
jgi:hypothetical protein